MKKIIIALVVIAAVGLGYYFFRTWEANKLNNIPYLAHGNGRIEATEINISARLSGKVEKVRVLEGEKVKAGEPLVLMQTNVLVADLARAEATLEQAKASEVAAQAKIQVQEANLVRAKANQVTRETELSNAKNRYDRYKKMVDKGATSQQDFETEETKWLQAKSNLDAAIASVKEVEANLSVAKADAIGAKANILAAKAEIERIKADIDDSVLKAPLDGRIQYRVAEPGEVLSAGGRVLNMVDLTDVYMTFFLSEELSGKVKIGADVRIVLDVAPDAPLPAKVTYVADVAQFTPKTVETQVERQKLMFRIKAHINRGLLEKFIDNVKTGLPGVAWVKLDDSQPWPKELEINPERKKQAEELYRKAQEKAAKTSDVVDSKTEDEAHSTILNKERIEKFKAENKNLTKEQAIEAGVMAAKKISEIKNQNVDKEVKVVKEVNQKNQEQIDKGVEAVKKVNEDAKKATVNGDKK